MQGNEKFEGNVLEYISKTGNRISQSKFDLIEETKKLFHDLAGMVTYLPEAELLKMLVQLTGAKKGIEIGVFTGLSSLCIAEGLPEDGKLLCFDVSEEFTSLARKYWKLNNVDHKIELTLAPAVDSLSAIVNDQANLGTFDFAYIDADKNNYMNYYELMLKLLKPNGFIIFDNTLWNNRVLDPEKNNDENTTSLAKLNKFLQADTRVSINMLNIGDGMTIVRKI